ncbi:peptidyl-prolyl cis-trans isomerase [Salipiger mangrovisoli]|uniref:Peptidyl-prolyl cis-trans isomerase n=1 Tax=Salipiger mangrovisoli TaxID=2865933 RepID=A0ABR9WX20_9RHOB|nr:peptidyl-prolyl cis-trans isomerase [Salipiger mangrovisoli]MBE9635836.1 peptidyl-prolyl cis-trans isomerase [Salipiger mangrovisoli]
MARGKSSIGKTLVWGLLILVVLGFGAFGTVNFTGGLRGIGSVGDTEISVNDYSRALQNEMRAFEAQTGQPMTLEQAQQFGLDRQVLAQVVTNAALDDEASRIGLSVGDDQVAEALGEVAAFHGPDGKFSRESYAYALRNAGLTEAEFEAGLRSESARNLLNSAIYSGTALPDTYVDTLLGWAGETRDFSWARLEADALETGLPVPGDDELQAWYDDNVDRFTLPETKLITYAWITPDMIVDSVELDEATLRAAYEERSAEFNLPERRLVERLVFGNEAEAQAAMDRIASGEITFEALVEERGLQLADTDLGDMTRQALGEAGDGVFAIDTGEVAGPLPSNLGPALYRVNAILHAQETPYEQAVPMMRDELALDRARRVIEGMAQSLDDELAGGATLEELANDTEMELGTIAWNAQSDETIAGYDAFREAAEAVSEDDYPAISDLGDGGVFAIRLDEIRPPAPRPFDEVKDEVAAGWDKDKTTELLVAQADDLAQQLAQGASFADLGLEPNAEQTLTRDAQISDLPSGLLDAAFEMKPGDARAVSGDGAALILRLDAVTPVDRDSDASKQLEGLLKDRAAGSVAQDLFRAFVTDIQERAGVNIDQQAVNAVHTNFR